MPLFEPKLALVKYGPSRLDETSVGLSLVKTSTSVMSVINLLPVFSTVIVYLTMSPSLII